MFSVRYDLIFFVASSTNTRLQRAKGLWAHMFFSALFAKFVSTELSLKDKQNVMLSVRIRDLGVVRVRMDASEPRIAKAVTSIPMFVHFISFPFFRRARVFCAVRRSV